MNTGFVDGVVDHAEPGPWPREPAEPLDDWFDEPLACGDAEPFEPAPLDEPFMPLAQQLLAQAVSASALRVVSPPAPVWPTVLGCPLCETDGGLLIANLGHCRVIRPNEPGFPALYRVVSTAHVPEWSDLPEGDQMALMRVINTVERALRDTLHPSKINLAALGNVVPHLHWHVVARFDWDSHFPAPIWGQPQRVVEPGQLAVLEHLLPRVDQLIRQRLLPW